MKSKLVTLSISHNIFLTREERYSLHSGEPVTAIGVGLPVWFFQGTTSEPGEEVFCEYLLKNEETDKPIVITQTHYELTLPQMPKDFVKEELSDDEWRAMPVVKQREWYEKSEAPISSKNLLDYQDKGAKYLTFKINQLLELNNQEFNIIHFIVIRDIEELLNSLTTTL
jgi:hypothetical protein